MKNHIQFQRQPKKVKFYHSSDIVHEFKAHGNLVIKVQHGKNEVSLQPFNTTRTRACQILVTNVFALNQKLRN